MDKLDKFLWVEEWLIENEFYRWYFDIKHFGKPEGRIQKCFIVLNDECLWRYRKNKHSGKEFKIETLLNAPDYKTCANQIARFYDRFHTDYDFKKFMLIYVNGRNGRISGYNNPRYQRLNDEFKKIINNDCCMKCGSNHEIQLDHIQNHYNFKDEIKAYSINNLQWLCGSCNRNKSEYSSEDFRTEKHKIMIDAYVRLVLMTDPIIP